MSKPWLVLKFGGTSVSGKQQWETIASLAKQRTDDGYRVLLVCSAVSGVTNALEALADNANGDYIDDVEALLDRHRKLSADLEVESGDLIDTAGQEIFRLLRQIGQLLYRSHVTAPGTGPHRNTSRPDFGPVSHADGR